MQIAAYWRLPDHAGKRLTLWQMQGSRAMTNPDRKASVERATKETQITVTVDLDGKGVSSISTGVGFFDHMLDQLSRHSLIDMKIEAKGDLQIDDHHTV